MTKFSEVVVAAERRSAIKGPRAISRAAKAKGYTLSHGTVSKVLNGTHGNVSNETVQGLAAVLPVTEKQLYRALGVAGPGLYKAPAAADRLTPVQRDLINALIHQIVRPEEGTGSGTPAEKSDDDGGAEGSVIELNPTKPAPATPAKTAARKGKSQGRAVRKRLGEAGEESQVDLGADEGGA